MARYTDLVEEAQRLLKRSEKDSWRLAELTHEAVKVKGKTIREWAKDIGRGRSTVERWLKIWSAYGVPAPGQDRPTFFDAMLEIDPRGGGDAQKSKELARERQVRSALSELPAESAARLVAETIHKRPEVVEDIVRDASAMAKVAKAEVGRVSEVRSQQSRPRSAPAADELLASQYLYHAKKDIRRALEYLRDEGAYLLDDADVRRDLKEDAAEIRVALDFFESVVRSKGRTIESALAEWEESLS